MSADTALLPDLAAIEAAEDRIREQVSPTPTLQLYALEKIIGQALWAKAESLQRTGSFKARGAVNWLLTASAEELDGGLVTVSAGNHALALAWAAARVGVSVTVMMPAGSSPMKVAATRAYGAEVIVEGSIQEAVERCMRYRDERGMTLVHPYNDPRIMAGQGTVGLELLRQLPALQRVLCPIGGGGLISGVGLALKGLKPDIELIGVEPEGAATMRNAWNHGRADAALERIDTVAVSLGPAVVGAYTFAASRQVVDDVVTVSDPAIIEATKLMATSGHLYAETGAVVGLAALLDAAVPVRPDQVTATIVTGGNMDLSQLCGFASSA
ncbi:threonine ammonia-lyase [Mangrovitalea sediminis]|uniref:threonine ammonia-lyase n=1 Tax=Mangrovitalea sediminis TaxID=1982043 RepID=UPI000BE6223D|nr:pyridoxal-phosphate dependent enzyme [Mangrovitalea sediminis]